MDFLVFVDVCRRIEQRSALPGNTRLSVDKECSYFRVLIADIKSASHTHIPFSFDLFLAFEFLWFFFVSSCPFS